jgi:hypothetical protein
MSLYNKLGLFTIAVSLGWNCLLSEVNAQGLGNSPYSSLGMGELYNDSFSANTATGQAGVSTSNGLQINNLNPALWVRNKYTTLDFGVIGQYKDMVSGSKNQRTAGGNLAYVALSFPVAPRWSIGINLKPYSFIDYTNTSIRNIPGTPYQATYMVSGSGGVNKVSITNAFQVGKYVSLGLESSYFFGNVLRASEATLPTDVGADYLVSLNDKFVFKDFSFKGGAAVKVPLKKANKLNLNLGGTYSLGNNIGGNHTTSFDLTLGSFPIAAPDTITNDKPGYITLPSQYQVGMSLEWPYKLTVSADYSHQSWTQYRSFDRTSDGLKDVGRFHLGVEYIPKFLSLSYAQNIRYRLGFSHGKTPYVIDGNNINDTNVSLGAALPVGRELLHSISISLVGGQRGVAGPGMIRERYGRFVLGLTLMEKWFQKQKLD